MSRWPERFLGLRRRQLFNLYVLIGSVGIVVAVTMLTVKLAQKVETQSQLTTRIFASMASRFWGSHQDEQLQQIMQIMRQSEVPFIVSDNTGRPWLWNAPMLDIPLPADYQAWMREDISSPTNPHILRLLALEKEFDRSHQPFAIINPETRNRLGTLHYGQSRLSQRIRWMPYLELLLLAAFFLLILWALQMKKTGEQQRLFAGMAKETAHQLGTPITSIMGWIELLRERVDAADDVMRELDRDVARLGKVSARFSQIGSRPQLQGGDLTEVVDSAISYFHRRLPQLGGTVELRREGALSRGCRFNRDLMEWVLENLIKNGIDALADGKGTITIALADRRDGSVGLSVSDTGRGIAPGARNKIFEPGFSTKERGWGMGLALVRRIITQYHGGRIQVTTTGPQGTTFTITLPGEEPGRAV